MTWVGFIKVSHSLQCHFVENLWETRSGKIGLSLKEWGKGKKSIPFACGYAFCHLWVYLKICGYRVVEMGSSFPPSHRSAAHAQPLPAPCFYPTSHKFIKLFEICGAECGATMPHIRKKDSDFTLSPWISLASPRGFEPLLTA